MLTLSVLALVAGVATLTLAVTITEDGYYDTRYNHLDIERILNNKRLVTYYGQCLTGDGPCTPQGTEFKRILPEALRTNCAHCTEKQKVTAYLAIRRLKKEYPKIWQQMQVAWDPKGEYVSTFINTVESGTTPGAKLVTSSTTPGAKLVATGASSIVSSSTTPGVKLVSTDANPIVTSSFAPEISGRFGESDAPTDNEITAEAPATVPLTRGIPSSVASSSTSTTTTTAATPFTTTTTTSARPSVPPSAPAIDTNYYRTSAAPAIDTNYRTSLRPTRFNILLPRPQDIGRFTANWIGSIGDIGNKVIRTGARIADMVFSGVQAGVHATIGIGRPYQ